MKINKFKDLITAIHESGVKSKVAVVMAQDEHVLSAIVDATKDNLIDPILLGDQAEIKKILLSFTSDLASYTIMHYETLEECLDQAVALVHSGQATAIMKGKLETGQLMKAIVKKENNMKKGSLISLIGFYETEKYHKLFAVSDMGMNTYPDLNGKKGILENAVDLLQCMGIAEPKVAVMAAVEKVNPKMPETVDGNALKQMNLDGSISGCIVEGPISFDLATDKEAAAVKGYESPVAGDADLLLVPDMVSGNMLVKCLTGFAGANTAGIVVGAKVPIILTSRSAEASDKYYSIALAAYVGQQYYD